MNPGTLILVPNALDLAVPCGPLDEVLPVGVLRRAAMLTHWLAENARSARAFLGRVDAITPLALPVQAQRITELPRPPKGRDEPVPALAWSALLQPALLGHDIGLLSEAGLPAVADPGSQVVAAAHALGLRVLPLPGPSSIVLALAASGLDGQSFAFVGYLPQAPAARDSRIRAVEAHSRRQRQTQIFIETPYRNAALLQALLATLAPATRLSVAVGLTLPDGWTRTDNVAGWRQRNAALPDRVPAVFSILA